jgi:hypothetical protein
MLEDRVFAIFDVFDDKQPDIRIYDSGCTLFTTTVPSRDHLMQLWQTPTKIIMIQDNMLRRPHQPVMLGLEEVQQTLAPTPHRWDR